MDNWTAQIIKAAKERQSNDRSVLVVVDEDDKRTRESLVSQLAREALRDLKWDRHPEVLHFAFTKQQKSVVVVAQGEKIEKVKEGAQVARSLNWFFIVSGLTKEEISSLSNFEPIIVRATISVES